MCSKFSNVLALPIKVYLELEVSRSTVPQISDPLMLKIGETLCDEISGVTLAPRESCYCDTDA